MNSGRIRLLEQYAKEDPNDPFPPYALALELFQSNPLRAAELFSYLMAQHADYVPTYYHAALLARLQSNQTQAENIALRGIEKAKASGDQKAATELRSLLDEND